MFCMRCIPLIFYTQRLCQVKLPQWHHTNTWLTGWLTQTLITFTGVLNLSKLENRTLCISSANRDDNDDSFTTLDEVSVICRAVICLVITINKAVRHYDHDLIVLLLNHCMGVKGGVGEERWTKTIKSVRVVLKYLSSECARVKTISKLPSTSGPCLVCLSIR